MSVSADHFPAVLQSPVPAGQVVKGLMKMGVLASVTQSIAASTAEELARTYGAVVTTEGGDDDAETDVRPRGHL